MLHLSTKLYVQLAPNAPSHSFLSSLQRQLQGSTDATAASDLHLSVLHVGQLEKLLRSFDGYANPVEDDFLQHADRFAAELEELIVNAPPVTIHAVALRLFGKRHTTLVLECEPTVELTRTHHKALALLQGFLEQCGIRDATEFMRRDSNLQYALTLRPHVTLFKSFDGDVRDLPYQPLTLNYMPIRYTA